MATRRKHYKDELKKAVPLPSQQELPSTNIQCSRQNDIEILEGLTKDSDASTFPNSGLSSFDSTMLLPAEFKYHISQGNSPPDIPITLTTSGSPSDEPDERIPHALSDTTLVGEDSYPVEPAPIDVLPPDVKELERASEYISPIRIIIGKDWSLLRFKLPDECSYVTLGFFGVVDLQVRVIALSKISFH